MKKGIFFCSLVLLLTTQSWGQEGILKVKVTNIETIEGNIMLAVYDSKDTFLSETTVTTAMKPVEGEEMWLEFPRLGYGTYAVSIYHDVNADQELQTNFMGIPKEPYGFSNEVGLFGVPSFEKSKFEFQRKVLEIEIELK